MSERTHPTQLLGIVALWAVACLLGLAAMAVYGAREGRVGEAPTRWPTALADQGIAPVDGRPTLVMLAHPLCPCTESTLVELEGLTNRLHGLFDTHILFHEPAPGMGSADQWSASRLRAMAERLPGTRVHADSGSRLAKHFGAYTSGHVLLYGSDGDLRFSGGITPSRGHTGDNPGRAAITVALTSDPGVDALATTLTPVYGCSLHTENKLSDDRKSRIAKSGI